MVPYYLLVFLPAIPVIIWQRKLDREKRSKIAIALFFIMFFLLLALRNVSVGRDLSAYEMRFKIWNYSSFSTFFNWQKEPMFYILNEFISLFTNNFQWVLVACAVLTVVPCAFVYGKYADYPIMTIALFVSMSTFIMCFSGLRQSIAISLGMIAFEFTRRRQLIPFILIVILAITFHKSAFMIAFMYPLYHLKITKVNIWFIIPIIIAIFIFNKPIFTFLSTVMQDYYQGEIIESFSYTMLVLLIAFAVFSYVIPDNEYMDADTMGFRNFLLLAIVVQLFAPLNPLAMRLGYYYLIFIPLLIPRIISSTSVRWRQIAFVSRYVITAFFLVYFFVIVANTNSLDTFPYRFFWETA